MTQSKFLPFLLLLFVFPCISKGQSTASNKLISPRIRVIIDNDFGGDPDGKQAILH